MLWCALQIRYVNCNIRTMIKYASLFRNLLHCAKSKGSKRSGEGAGFSMDMGRLA